MRLTLAVALLCPAVVGAHQPHDPVQALALSPSFASDRTVFAATSKTTQVPGVRMILKSTDGGETWRTVHRGLPNLRVVSLAVSPRFDRDRLVIAGTCGQGLFRSTDAGESWRPVESAETASSCATTILFPEGTRENATVYALGADDGLLRSTDGGSAWSPLPLPEKTRPAALVGLGHGEQGERLALGTDRGLLLSRDGGRHWRPAGNPLGTDPVVAILSYSADGEEPALVAATGRGIWRSRDGGTSWRALARVAPGSGTRRQPLPGEARRGTVPPESLPEIQGLVTDLAAIPAPGGEMVLVATTWKGIWVGRRGGARWSRASRGLRPSSPQSAIHFREVAVSKAVERDGTLFVGGFEGVHRSRDGGRTWTHLEIIPAFSTRGVAISPGYADDGTLFAATYGSGLLASRDRGRTWTPMNEGLWNTYLDPVVPAPDYGEGGVAFLGNWKGIAWRAANASQWTQQPMFEGAADACSNAPHGGGPAVRNYVRAVGLSPDFTTDRRLIAGGESGCLYSSENGGASWRLIHDSGAVIMDIRYVRRPEGPPRILVGLRKGGLIRSLDGGRSWARVDTFPPTATVSSIELSPRSAGDGLVFAGTLDSGLLVSRDHGKTWARVPGLGGESVLALAISPEFSEDQTLFASVNGQGVLRSGDGGAHWTPTGLDEPLVMDLDMSPAFGRDRTLLAGTLRGPALTTDGGRSWMLVLDRTRYEERTPRISRRGWALERPLEASGQATMVSRRPGAALEFRFTGSRVAWIAKRGPRGGWAEVWLDGQPQGTVDLLSDKDHYLAEVYRSPDLPPGSHLLRIEVPVTLPPALPNGEVVVDAFDVWFRPSGDARSPD